MKKILNWAMATALICGASVFTACSSDDDKKSDVENLSEKIIGKWMVAELDGQPCPTNLKAVVTFVSPTRAYGSLSDFYSSSWNDQVEASVKINGNDMTIHHGQGYGAELSLDDPGGRQRGQQRELWNGTLGARDKRLCK